MRPTRTPRPARLIAAAALAAALAAPAALAEDQGAVEPPARGLGPAAPGTFAAPAPDAGQQARIGVLVDSANPARLVDLLRAAGVRAELDTSEPTPLIVASADGTNFVILFYGCRNGQDCTAIQFISGFQMNTPPTLQRINEWNAGRIVGQAYTAPDGSIRIAHYVALRYGMSETNFAYTVEQWRIALRDFRAHIGFG